MKDNLIGNFAVDAKEVNSGSLSHRNILSFRLEAQLKTFEEEYNDFSGRLPTFKDSVLQAESQIVYTEGQELDERRDASSHARSERTPFRRSRSERKQAWLESTSSVCKEDDCKQQQYFTKQGEELSQPQPLPIAIFDYQYKNC